MKKFNKFKKVNNLRFNLNLEQFYDILDYLSEFHHYNDRIIEESERIDERNFEEVQFLCSCMEELLESDLYKHIPQRFMSYDWDDAISEANKAEEAYIQASIEEYEELERWYYSTRL